MNFSVIVPAYNAEASLPSLLDSLSRQTIEDFETIVVDDGSEDGTGQIARSYGCSLIQPVGNHGPAYCRNMGANNALGEVIAFTDSDCVVEHNWLETQQKHFSQNDCEAIMGKLVLMQSNFLGNSISALGFPAGGSIGFDKIWKVDQQGFTNSLSSCNCAIRKDIFWQIGGFDDSFPYAGGEDSYLAYLLRRKNYRIRYCPDVVAYHDARNSFQEFLKWQFRRGISTYIFSTKVSHKQRFFSLRLWSTGNIIRQYWADGKFPLILSLLCTSFLAQFIGFLFAKYSKDFHASSHH